MDDMPQRNAPGRRVALCAVLLLAAAGPASAFAPSESVVEISVKDLDDELGRITLHSGWRFSPADDPAFAATDVDDGDWPPVDTRLRDGERPEGWNGFGWFRLRLSVSPGLRGVPLALAIHHQGAVEVFLNGAPLYAAGVASPEPEATFPRLQRRPSLFSFEDSEEHVLAVRFANHDADAYQAAGRIGGFEIVLGDANRELAVHGESLRSLAAHQALFTGLLAAFALLHLLFYAFYRQADENLYFGLLAGTVAAFTYLFFHGHLTEDPRFFLLWDRGRNVAWLVLGVVALRFVYGVYARRPRWFAWAAGAAAALAVPAWFFPSVARPWILLALLLASAEMVRTVIAAGLRRQAGARIVGLGILILAAGTSVGLLSHLGVLPSSLVTAFLIPFGSVLALLLTMSVYLSRRFAQANRELRAQLAEVRRRSEEKLERERRAAEDELTRRLLEAENRRQAEELEEARRLQLSMLPESLPALPNLEIAAGMFTATEVGGDYYDFELGDDGTLTLAIGDATGHGMRAGTLVTATKSLFKALAAEDDLTEALARFGEALKRMNLHQLSMALTLARVQGGRLRLAAAGMPPALVHRVATGEIVSVGSGGVPLGSLSDFPYRETTLDLEPGDTVLLMSDGFPERLNGDDEMLGYDQVRDAFARAAAATPPQAIIDRLVADADAWAAGKPPADDTTFVVLKVR